MPLSLIFDGDVRKLLYLTSVKQDLEKKFREHHVYTAVLWSVLFEKYSERE